MKIAVNCWPLRNKDIDGIGRFTIETIRHMVTANPGTEFLIMCDKNFTEDYFDFPNVRKHHIFPALRHPILYVYFMQVVVKGFLRKHKPDIFLSTDGMLSLGSECKQIPVIHDIYFEHSPKDLTLKNRIYYRTYFRKFAHKAARIATISEYSKQDIAATYKIPADKIDVVPLAGKTSFAPVDHVTARAIKDKYTGGADYFYFVGSMHPRKNIAGLMKAFDLFKERTGSAKKLVLIGHILWSGKEIMDVLNSIVHRNDIVFTGRIDDTELILVAGSSFCLAFVPLFEGFGLPIVEAFASGIPVICSNVTSMPEVGGDAVLLADPFNVDSIADAMILLEKDEGLRQLLIMRGTERRKQYTWERTAALLFESVKKAAASS